MAFNLRISIQVLMIGGLLCWYGQPTFASSCRPLEYAEIKDMSIKELAKTYCLYGELGELESNTAKKLNDIFIESLKKNPQLVHTLKAPKDNPDYRQLRSNAAECFTQQGKIADAMKRRGAKEPTCPAAKP